MAGCKQVGRRPKKVRGFEDAVEGMGCTWYVMRGGTQDQEAEKDGNQWWTMELCTEIWQKRGSTEDPVLV